MSTVSQQVQKKVRARMEADGTMARIRERQQRHEAAARKLGYTSAQEAYNHMGQDFLNYANQA